MVSRELQKTTTELSSLHLSLILTIFAVSILGRCCWVELTDGIKREPDTGVYHQLAAMPVLSSNFWIAGRPPLVPLFYKVVGPDEGAIVRAQVILSAVSWALLAVSLLSVPAPLFLRLIAAALAVAAGGSSDIVAWDRFILSESLSLSFLAITVATLVRFSCNPTLGATILVMIIGSAWCLSRDANVFMLGTCAICGVAFGVWSSRFRMKVLSIAAIVGAMFVYTSSASDRGDRWLFPFSNVMLKRIVHVTEYYNWFVAHGMPPSESLRGQAHKWASEDDWLVYKAADLEPYRVWARSSAAKVTYARFLLSHPAYLFKKPLDEIADITPQEAGGRDPSVRYVWRFPSYLYAFVPLLIAVLIALYRHQFHPLFLLGVLFSVSVVPAALITFHGDSMEVPRHSLQIPIMLWMGAVTTFLGAIVYDQKNVRSPSFNL